jgi:hypothetical protein
LGGWSHDMLVNEQSPSPGQSPRGLSIKPFLINRLLDNTGGGFKLLRACLRVQMTPNWTHGLHGTGTGRSYATASG